MDNRILKQTVLKPANLNHWYQLATFFGEQTGSAIDKGLHDKNRRIWNAWIFNGLSNDEVRCFSEEYADRDLRIGDFQSLGFANPDLFVAAFIKKFKNAPPDPNPASGYNVDLQYTQFEMLCMEGFIFPPGVSFRGSSFAGLNYFQNTIFATSKNPGYAGFDQCEFVERADFEDAIVNGHAQFSLSRLLRGGNFSGARFNSGDFNQGEYGRLNFEGVVFRSNAYFDGSEFEDIEFQNTKFGGLSTFQSEFQGSANFRAAVFKQDAIFHSARFLKDVTFALVEFRGLVWFLGGAIFEGTVPEFFGAVFRNETRFQLKKEVWPPISLVPVSAPNTEGATPTILDVQKDPKERYSNLRGHMKELHNVEAEQFFFRQEMRCATHTKKQPENFLFRAYGYFSDFGHSVWRPFIFLVLSIAFFALIFSLANICAPSDNSCPRVPTGFWSKFGLSVSNAIPVFGFRSTFLRQVYLDMPGWLQIISGIQTIFSFILLFFLGLGLRNKFRLR